MAHTRHCLVSWACPWWANVLPCLGTARHCTWQCSGGGVLCAAVRVDTATVWYQPTSPCFFQWDHQSQDLSTGHTLDIKTSKQIQPARLTELIFFSHQFYAIDSPGTSVTCLLHLQQQLQLHQAFCTHCSII